MGIWKYTRFISRVEHDIRAVASMYSWGGGGIGQKFPNDGKKFRIFYGIRSHEGVCYPENEDAILQFTNKNTHSLRKDILQKGWERGPKARGNF